MAGLVPAIRDASTGMALGDAINLLLHRAGIGIDVEGDRQTWLPSIPLIISTALHPSSSIPLDRATTLHVRYFRSSKSLRLGHRLGIFS